MRTQMKDMAKQIFAWLLVFGLIAGTLPVSALAADANHPDDFTVEVKEDGTAVEGAIVAYQIKVNDTEVASGTTATDADGVAVIAGMDSYAEQIAAGTVKLSCTVSKAGYDQAEKEEAVTAADGSMAVSLTKTPAEMVTITVVKTGNGTVTVNGSEKNTLTVEKGSEVTVEARPGTGAYIQQFMIGKTEEVADGEGKKPLSKTFTADENTTVTAKFVTQYTVSAKDNKYELDGGKITLNGTGGSITDDEGSIVTLEVNAKDGYQIQTVKIDGVDQTITDAKKFETTIQTISKDIMIEASFMKVYTVTVNYDNTHGTVTTTPEGAAKDGGIVTTLEQDGKLTVTATPNPGYRVSKVVKNNAESEFTDNNAAYTNTVETVKEDYEYTITFAPNRCQVQVTVEGTEEMGEVSYSGGTGDGKFSSDWDKTAQITILQKEGYHVSSVTVDGSEKLNSDVLKEEQGEENKLVLSLTNGEAKKDSAIVRVVFASDEELDYTEKENPLEGDDYQIAFVNSEDETVDAIRDYTDAQGNHVYVLPANAKIKVTPENPYTMVQVNGTGDRADALNLTETQEIFQITVSKGSLGRLTPKHMKLKLKLVLDKTEPKVEFNPDAPNENGYYCGNVNVGITVADPEEYSGIDKVEYAVVNGEMEPTEYEPEPLYTHKEEKEILSSCTRSITVKAENHNFKNVRVYVKVTDLAGNVYVTKENACLLHICTDKPEVSVSSIDGTLSDEAMEGYYNSIRTAKVTIVDREDAFDEGKATDAIQIRKGERFKEGKEGQELEGDNTDFHPSVTWAHNGNAHTGTITFDADGAYIWDVSALANYTNKAGLADEDQTVQTQGDSLEAFTIDRKAPNTWDPDNPDAENLSTIGFAQTTWSKLAETLSFGAFSNKEVTVVAEGKDDTSPVQAIQYYKMSEPGEHLDRATLEGLYQAGEFQKETYTVNQDEAFVVYARITDYAGNTVYIGTDGVIVDMTAGIVELSVPELPAGQTSYNTDVTVGVTVDDLRGSQTAYAGIKTIKYSIKVKDQEEENKFLESPVKDEPLYPLDSEKPVSETRLDQWEGEIPVDAEIFNYDGVVVTVTAEDNAGNIFKASTELNICTDKPTISVSFSDEANRIENGRGYFDKERTATITITDRSSVFDEEKVELKDDEAQPIEWQPENWTHTKDPKTKKDIHTGEITFANDGNYTWSLSYINKAGLTCQDSEVQYEGTTPQTFTVDKTDPTGKVEIGENSWTRLIEVLTFGLYSKESVTVTASGEDQTSPVVLEYYITDETTAKKQADLDRLYENDKLCQKEEEKNFHSYEGGILLPSGEDESDEQFVVYLRVTDYAGNYIYVSSDGYVVDATPSTIEIIPEPANENGIYNHDVKVQIKANEGQGKTGDYSGIKEIICEVRNGTETTQTYGWNYAIERQTEVKPLQGDLKRDISEEITVEAEKNNSSKVTVWVQVTDNAGNESTQTLELDIDITPPEIEISYQGNYAVNGKYFPAMRKATVKIRERSNHFAAEDAKRGITITARDAKGNLIKDIDLGAMVGEWTTTTSNRGPDWDVHTAEITYSRDANYTFQIAYTDKAGNKAEKIDTGDSVAPYEFTVDQTKPTGTVKAETGEKKDKQKATWDELSDELTFGFWSKEEIRVTGTSDDQTSPIERVDYYQTDNEKAIGEAELRTMPEDQWKPFTKVAIQPNRQAVIYVRIKDMAGNVSYISSDGMIADNRKPKVESLAPKITIEPEKQPVNGIYKKNVKVNIKVQDPEAGGTYSGLKEIKYRVLNKALPKKDQITQSGVLYSFEELLPSQKDLKKSWSGSITVDSAKNNSNHVVIQVYAEDNAGNIRGFGSQESKKEIKIDTTAPRIDVSYNNNSPDSGKYYRNDRVATITVTERNFDPDQVKAAIRNTSGAVPALSNWTTIAGNKDGNGDDTRHTATLTYHADGDYTFGIRCTDLAGHECPEERVGYGNSANPKEFTIDQTAPVVTVSYDNNDAQNGKYFKEKRTATVTITERNFDESRVQFTPVSYTHLTLPTICSV